MRVAAGSEPFPVAAERHLVHVATVADGAQCRAVRSAPIADHCVVTSSCEETSIRTVVQPDAGLRVSGQSLQRTRRDRIPQPNGIVEATAGQPPAVRAEPDFPHVARMPAQLRGWRGRFERPDTDDGILSGCGEALPVRRNGERPEWRSAGPKGPKLLAGRHIPFAHNSVISGAEQARAVRAE